jgi:ribosomal protein S18 acetylase RimI-like enzyme
MFQRCFGVQLNTSYIPQLTNLDYIVVIYINDLIVGFALVQENFDDLNTSYISGICVHSEYRKRVATSNIKLDIS